jgi:hypothetical protein
MKRSKSNPEIKESSKTRPFAAEDSVRLTGPSQKPTPEIKIERPPDEEDESSYSTIYDFLKPTSPESQKTLRQCAFGHYPEKWYKFKRFESLSLLNLYHYQQELVEFEKCISQRKGVMTRDERNCLRIMMKDYCK